MTFRVHIENYQSIEDADLEISGLTIIVGQNNAGKSALMRALRGPYMNTNGNGYIRHGKTRMCVRQEFSDGQSIQWEKVGKIPTKGKNKGVLSSVKANYIVNGEEINEVGQSVPEEALSLGIKSIQIGSDKVWPQIAVQVSDVFFLVNRPGYAIAEAVADVERVGELNMALRLCDKEARGVTTQLKVRKKDLEKLESQVSRFDGLDVTLASAETVEKLHTSVSRTLEGYTRVQGLKTRYDESSQVVESLAWVEEVEVPSVDPLEDLFSTIEVVTRLKSQLERCESEIKLYTDLDSVEIPDESLLKKLQKIYKVIGEVQQLKIRLDSSQKDLDRLRPVDDLDVGLESDLKSLRSLSQEVKVVGGLQQRLSKAASEVESAGIVFDKAESAWLEAKNELYIFETKHPVCSACGQLTRNIQ